VSALALSGRHWRAYVCGSSAANAIEQAADDKIPTKTAAFVFDICFLLPLPPPMLAHPIDDLRTLLEVAGPAPRVAAWVIGRVDLAVGGTRNGGRMWHRLQRAINQSRTETGNCRYY